MKLRHQISALAGVTTALFSLTAGEGVLGEILAENLQQANIAQAAQVEGKGLVAFSPDGEFYVFATEDGRLKYCRTQDGATLHTLIHCHPKAVVFSADGRLLASAGGPNGSAAKIKIWCVEDGALLSKIETDVGKEPLLSFSADGVLLISTSGESRLNLWRVTEGTLEWSTTLNRSIRRMAFSSDSKAIAVVCADGRVRRFDLK